MRSVIYALFKKRSYAAAAQREIQQDITDRGECKVTIHDSLSTYDASAVESRGLEGLCAGVLIGAATGGVFGLLLSALGAWLPVMLYVLLGTVLGGLGGGLYASGAVSRGVTVMFAKLKRGQVLMTAEVTTARALLTVEHVLSRCGS